MQRTKKAKNVKKKLQQNRWRAKRSNSSEQGFQKGVGSKKAWGQKKQSEMVFIAPISPSIFTHFQYVFLATCRIFQEKWGFIGFFEFLLLTSEENIKKLKISVINTFLIFIVMNECPKPPSHTLNTFVQTLVCTQTTITSDRGSLDFAYTEDVRLNAASVY